MRRNQSSQVRKGNGRAWAPVAPSLLGVEELDGWRQASFQSTMEGEPEVPVCPPTHHHAAAEWSDPGFPLDRQEHLPLVQADKSLTFIVLIRESSPRVTELKMVSMDCHQ